MARSLGSIIFRSPLPKGAQRERVSRDYDGDTSAGGVWLAREPVGNDAYASGEERTKDLSHYLEILLRRKWQILSPAALLFALSVVLAFYLPSVYRSTASILIEEQDIPPELLRSSPNGYVDQRNYADQRIQVISQQIMTRANLWQIIEKFDLYHGIRGAEPSEAILDRMRRDIKLNIVNADIFDQRSGNKTAATIAFTLSFDGATPKQAQQVTNELASLYLNKNLKSRQERAAEASNFFAEEAKKLSDNITQSDAKLAAFKEKNIGQLPELQQLNLQMRERMEADVIDTERQLQALDERKFYLQSQLAQVKPNTPIYAADGERILDTDERLKILQSQYAASSATYSPEHPDMVKMRREIAALEGNTGGASGTSTQQAREVSRLRAELASAREKYAEDHPDVVKLKRSLAALEQSLRSAPGPETQVLRKKPENPAYIALQTQLQSNESETKALRAKQGDLRARMADLEKRLQQTPAVEREYLELVRARDNAVNRYQEIRAKQMEAKVSQELEQDLKGERFSLIEPPQLPELPVRPNRKAIVVLGLILSLGGGLGYGALRETLDHSVRGPTALASQLTAPLLAVIPYVESARVERREQYRKWAVVCAIFGGIAVVALIVHLFVMPLDAFWSMSMEQMVSRNQ